MKRTDLKSIKGLSKEQIESIMNLHQLDIIVWKKKIAAKDKLIGDLREDNQCLKEVINEFKDIDIQGLKQEVSYWKDKYSIDINKIKYEQAVSLVVAKYGNDDQTVLNALLDDDTRHLFYKK